MKSRASAAAGVVVSFCLTFGAGSQAHAQARSTAPSAASREPAMTTRASGTFDVKMTPQAADSTGTTSLGRMTLDKRFHGDLEATSKGQMLAASTAVEGSAGYVALEQVTGTLKGRRGTFVLQHTGTMNRGTPQLSITVVPDSGTDELAGLVGSMTIIIADGKHSYDFDYTLAATP
jgi:hypothetical protein